MRHSVKSDRKIDFKQELEAASHSMIMVHEPDLLIAMIIRMIVQRLDLQHAGMVVFNPATKEYQLTVSKGDAGYKIPSEFGRFSQDSPIVKIFLRPEYRPFFEHKHAVLWYDLNRMIWQEGMLNGDADSDLKELLHQVSDQMHMLGIVACVPAIYREDLLAVLLLGEKEDGRKFDKEELSFFGALASDAAMALRNAQLFEQIKRQAEHNHDLFLRMTMTLGAAIEVKDKYTRGHSEGVTRYALAIAEEMRAAAGRDDFDQEFFEDLYIAGILHDIGKIGVPESILNKPGALTPEEYALVKRHPVDGVAILKPLSELKRCIEAIRAHHERFDGSGYPDGLQGEAIPMIAAIIAVADTLDAIVTQRPYRKSRTLAEAIDEVRRYRGTQFRPDVVDAAVRVYNAGRFPQAQNQEGGEAPLSPPEAF